MDLMKSLATEDEDGLPMAHTWLANFYRTSQFVDLSKKERMEIAQHHLEFARKANPQDILANCGLAAIYREQNELEKAVELYEIAFRQPLQSAAQLIAVPQIIEIRQELGQESQANTMAKAAISQLTPIAMNNPDMLQFWITLVQCCVLTRDYDQAEALIKEGFELADDKEVKKNIARLASEIMVKKAEDNSDANDREQFQQRLWALSQAVATDFRNAQAYRDLMFFVANDNLTDEQQIWLRDSIVGCPSPGVIHIILGMQKIRGGNYVEGQKHWRIGHQQFQFAEYAINNLIEMSYRQDPDVGQAKMDWIEIAIEMFPEQRVLLLTRGGFYVDDKEYQKAIDDLEKVVEQLPNMISVHEKLVTCYEAIGNQEKADLHKVTLEVLLESLSKQQQALIRAGAQTGRIAKEDGDAGNPENADDNAGN